jgi:hypothetical protein
MSANQTLLRKADLAIADMQATGGELQPEEGASFIRKLIKQPTIVRQARIVEMTSSKRRINKIGFGARILRKAVSATALTQSQRSKPITEQIELESHEQIAEVRLPYDVLEDNIERATAANNEASNTGPGGLRQTLIDLMGERSALDLEELGLLGDVDYVNALDQDDEDYLSQLDGWLKISAEDGNVADAEGGTIGKAIFKAGTKTMPDQYLRNKAAMKHFISMDNETEYRDIISDRGTPYGDATLQGNSPMFAFGTPIEAVSLMPEDKGLFCNPKNLIFGIQRSVSMEFAKDITARVYIIVLTMRIAFAIEEPEAVVLYENIAVA